MRATFRSIIDHTDRPATIANVRAELRALGFTLTKDDGGDFRVSRRNDGERGAYYTNDLLDALNTARAMARPVAETTPEAFDEPNASDVAKLNARKSTARNVRRACVLSLPDSDKQSAADREGHRDNIHRPKLSARDVNRALTRHGIRGEVVQGRGYVYFAGDDFDGAYSTSVAVCWLNDLSLAGWLGEARYILEHDRNIGTRGGY